jgi:hypothetical protein
MTHRAKAGAAAEGELQTVGLTEIPEIDQDLEHFILDRPNGDLVHIGHGYPFPDVIESV